MKIVDLTDLPKEGVSHDPQIVKTVMIRDGEFPHLTKFTQLRMSPGQIAHEHSHADEYEIFLIEAGECLAVVDAKEYNLSAGHCVVFEPLEVHEITSTGSEDLVMTYFGIRV